MIEHRIANCILHCHLNFDTKNAWQTAILLSNLTFCYSINNYSITLNIELEIETWHFTLDGEIEYWIANCILLCQLRSIFKYCIDNCILHFQLKNKIEHCIARDWTLKLTIAYCIFIWIMTLKKHVKLTFCYSIWLSVIQSITVKSIWILNWRL